MDLRRSCLNLAPHTHNTKKIRLLGLRMNRYGVERERDTEGDMERDGREREEERVARERESGKGACVHFVQLGRISTRDFLHPQLAEFSLQFEKLLLEVLL